MRIDFEVSGGGTVYPFKPLTRAAYAWVDDHLPADATWWCGAVVVAHRYIGPIVGGAIGDGLVVMGRYIKRPRSSWLFVVLGPFAYVVRWIWRALSTKRSV